MSITSLRAQVGGIALAPSWTWIGDTTGLHIIPEPGTLMLLVVGWVTVVLAGRTASRDRAAAVTPPDR